jgi:serralysin
MPLNANEQYLLELINRGRLNPGAEAARYGIDLNASLAAGTISFAAKQVLAPNALLEAAATGHSQWMLATNTFSHTGANGSNLGTRATAAGYQWSTVGENIAVWGTSGTLNMTSAVESHHRGLFLSAGHRTNLMNTTFTEIGLAQESGRFTFSSGAATNASMLTELFGKQSSAKFLTGVAYTDTNANSFYTVGEGKGGVVFTAGGRSVQTEAAGGYGLSVGQVANGLVSGTVDGVSYSATINFSLGNVKLDIVNGNMFHTSGSIILGTGINNATLLGVADINISGNANANRMIGNGGNNHLIGNGGNDVLYSYGGNDLIVGGAGHDVALGGFGNDRLEGGEGNDYLHGERGNDLLIGNSGADSFVFANMNGADVVQDFRLSEGDRLRLNDDLWTGSLTPQQVVSQFASVTSAGVVFNFGDGDVLTLSGVTSTAGLAGAILFW